MTTMRTTVLAGLAGLAASTAAITAADARPSTKERVEALEVEVEHEIPIESD